MHRFSARSLALGLVVTFAPAALVLESPGPVKPAVTATADEALEAAMGGLVDGMKALSKTIEDPASNAATLGTLAKMQGHALAAKELAPTNLADLEEKKRAAHTLAYRADMTRLLRELCEMEIEVCEGKNKEAMARVRGKLIPLRNASHDKYQSDE